MRAEQYGLGAVAEDVLELAELAQALLADALGEQLLGPGAQHDERLVGGRAQRRVAFARALEARVIAVGEAPAGCGARLERGGSGGVDLEQVGAGEDGLRGERLDVGADPGAQLRAPGGGGL